MICPFCHKKSPHKEVKKVNCNILVECSNCNRTYTVSKIKLQRTNGVVHLQVKQNENPTI